MIKKLRIQNFQSHKNTILEFNKGVNVIIGASDSGKTAIIRALRWLIWNKPGGSAFRSTWGGVTQIIATFDNGIKVIRKKDTKDEYMMGDLVYKAFGTNPPEDITKALNMSEVNLQQQLGAPFLLGKTPGQVAEYFNKIAGIDLIDKATKDIKKEIRATTQTISVYEDEIIDKQKQLKKYGKLRSQEKLLNELEITEKQKVALIRRKKDLVQIVENYLTIDERLKQQTDYNEIEQIIDSVLDVIQKKQNIEKQIDVLESLLNKFKYIERTTKKSANLIQAENDVSTILKNIQNNQQITAKIQALHSIITKYYILNKSINDLQRKQHDLQDILKQQHIEICPFCGTSLKTNKNTEK